jgi:prevent-host-death family protein
MANRQVLSEEARRNFGALLAEVQHQAAHVEIVRYRTRAAVIVPREWYERAHRALAATESESFPR